MPGLHKVKTVFQWKNAAFILKTLKEPKRLLVFTEVKNRVRFMCRHNQQRSSEDATKVCVCAERMFLFFCPQVNNKTFADIFILQKTEIARSHTRLYVVFAQNPKEHTIGARLWRLEAGRRIVMTYTAGQRTENKHGGVHIGATRGFVEPAAEFRRPRGRPG